MSALIAKFRIYFVLAALAGAVIFIVWYGESREQDGYNRAIAEQSKAVAEWQRMQRKEFKKALAAEKARAAILESDLSTLRSNFEALQSEVSHVSVVKPPRDAEPLSITCAGYNPLSPDFARLLNAGASGGRASAPDADTGNGEMPGTAQQGSR